MTSSSPMMSPSNKNAHAHSLGVLYTGWLNKKNPINGYYKKRFVVLTSEAIHWFKKETKSEKLDLFGEERGQIALSAVLSVRILDEDSNVLAIQATDRKVRYFKGENNTDIEEWVSAIRSAGQNNSRKPGRRTSRHGMQALYSTEDGDKMQEVSVNIITVKSANRNAEYVAARSPGFERTISVSDFGPDDEVIISTSNGGLVTLRYAFLESRAEGSLNEVEVPIQGVAIPQSLRMRISKESTSSSRATAAKTPSSLMQLMGVCVECTSNRSCSAVVMLSLMVVIVGINSIDTSSFENVLLCLLSACLALFSMSIAMYPPKISNASITSLNKTVGTSNYSIKINAHQYTSPDAPVHELDEEIPQRFINGCEGDMKEAQRRWDITRHWRESEGVNNVLKEPQPYFFTIRNHYPFYHAGRGREGHVVFYERPGDMEQQQLKARGVTTEQMMRNWLFVTEYQWQVLVGDEMGKSIAVIDIEHVSMSDLAGEKMELMKSTMAIANAHYPERSFAVFVVNAPIWFSFIWKLVKPLVHPNTQKKIKILSKREVLTGLQELIDISQIPSYYGGELDYGGPDSCRFESEDVVAMAKYVRALNEAETSDAVSNNASPVPPGKRGSVIDSPSDPKLSTIDDDVWSVCSGRTVSTHQHSTIKTSNR